jgi:tRNA pseudouridine38-40 synthase
VRRPERPGPKPSAFRLVLEYDGSRYQGWQKQGPRQTSQGVRTVAGTLERVLAEAGLAVVTLGGSGRTDAGVHALGQVAHLHLQDGRIKPWELQRALDAGLPGDVAVRSIAPCPLGFHARHDALSRTYLYQLSLRRTALAKPFVWWVKARLDEARLAEAWHAFQGNRSMAAFADLDKGEDPRCRILAMELERQGDLVLLRVTADHFLRRLVRRMVGAAVLCGLGKERPGRIMEDLEAPTPEANLFWGAAAAPASGLFLEGVAYPGGTVLDPLRPVARVDG